METITVGTHCLRLYLLAFIFQMGQFCGQSVFSALGQSKKAIFFSTLRKIIIILPLTLILPLYMGVDGVFAAEPISNIIGGTAAFTTMLVTVYFRLPKQDGEEAKL
jgi:Na+-driven multidrug efflux pump